MVFLQSFKWVAKSFWCGSLRVVLKEFQGVFKKLSRVFQEYLKVFEQAPKSVSKKLLKCMEILKVFQRVFEVFRKVSWVPQRNLKDVTRVFHR